MSQFLKVNSNEDHRYSRQSYTLGQDTQTKISVASILVFGYNTLAQEIIRNLSLIGIGNIDIFANKKILKQNVSNTGLYYSIKNDEIPLDDLRKLNPTINVKSVDLLNEKALDKNKIIGKYNLVIVTNSVIDNAIEINKITHDNNIPLIYCGVFGLVGYSFNDFGENFLVSDLDGEPNENLILETIDNNLLKFKDEHQLYQGDIIVIKYMNGVEKELIVKKKISPTIIELDEIPSQNKNDYQKINRKKISKIFNFESLEKNIVNPKHHVADWSVGMERSILLHNLYLAIGKYYKEFGELPKAWSIPNWELFYTKYLKELDLDENQLQLAKKMCYTIRGDLLPISSIIGGIVSHETLKVLSHKYIPIDQWYYIDYLDLLNDSEINSHNDYTCMNYKTKTKYDGLVNIFGKRFLEIVQEIKPFVIGSGAIGCELVKNLGMMGVKKIYLTDPDHIEKSNLSRQFLFNDDDLRQSKSETVSKKMKLFNPDVEIIGLKYKMCSETENYFNNEFHSKIDIYLNALDNVDARLYMDNVAKKYQKPLIDSGTLGSKGNVQVIIPHLTETYSDAQDPVEKTSIPICTIKSFPYKPEHTIQWARELFETEFTQIPLIVSKYKNNDKINKINDSDSKQLLLELYKYKDFTLDTKSFDKLIGTIWRENFYDNIEEIIKKYSKEENKEELGDKKLPKYFAHDTNIVEFYMYGYMLLNQMFSSNVKFNKNDFNGHLESTEFNYDLNLLDSEKIIPILKSIIESMPDMSGIEFEKDDDDLGHVQWIYLCSNIRNVQYSIPEIDLWEVRKIAGNIIPALITTTSLISGFQILEFIRVCKLYENNKYVNNTLSKDIDLYKNRFVNLNTNYCDGINPSNVKNIVLNNGKHINAWTNFKTSMIDTDKIIDKIESDTMRKIEFMIQGSKTIYDGEDICIEKIDPNNKDDVVVLLEDINFGIPVFYQK